MRLTFIETSAFTRRIVEMGLDERLRQLELRLEEKPTLGVVDPGTGGVRKIRMGDPGRSKGTRGGTRVHYLYLPSRSQVYLLFVYSKDERETLTARQKRQLRRIVEAIKEVTRAATAGGER